MTAFNTEINDKRDVNFPFVDDDIPVAHSYGIYSSQLVRFARICNKVSSFFTITKV